MDLKRLETARLFHRFGFGPRPGEFETALKNGVEKTRSELLAKSKNEIAVTPPVLIDLGKRPEPNSPDMAEFSKSMRAQTTSLSKWWLDQMVASENTLHEKMVWFWHGHWATSIGKVNYALPMYNQNLTFRKYALGNFSDFASAMFFDGALQVWLDGGENTLKAPNENLSREMMELFVLGVNRYSEMDVRELARAFTGYQIPRSTGEVVSVPRRRDTGTVTVLGKTGVMSPEEVIKHLVAQSDCAKFINERIWYRFISSSAPLPANHSSISAFASRDISALIKSMVEGKALANPEYSMVKSPVEWFIAVCRAFNLTPSRMNSQNKINGYFDKLSQIPFSPPNVGGWPTDEAWLSSASAQFRLAFATWIASQIDTSQLTTFAPEKRSTYLADLLGVVEWSSRTTLALREVRNNPERLITLAICSPEYVVSA